MPTVQENWPFDDPPNMAVITTRQVTEQGAPILFVSHDEDDGGWQFLTGGPLIEGDARVVALRRIWTLDPSVGELADLPLGWQASRSTVRESGGEVRGVGNSVLGQRGEGASRCLSARYARQSLSGRWYSQMVTAPLHIFFSAAGAGALRQTLASTRRTDEVICLDDNLSLGPIETFDPEVRMRWLATACRLNIDDWSWLPTAARIFWSRASSTTHRPIVWFTRNSAKEFAGFAAYLDQLGDRPFTAVDGTDIKVGVKHEAGQAEKTIMSLGELSADRMQALLDTDRPIGAPQLQEFGDIWAALQNDGALLRAVTGDELTSVPIDFFDHALLAACTFDWQRAVRVIATAMFSQVSCWPAAYGRRDATVRPDDRVVGKWPAGNTREYRWLAWRSGDARGSHSPA